MRIPSYQERRQNIYGFRCGKLVDVLLSDDVQGPLSGLHFSLESKYFYISFKFCEESFIVIERTEVGGSFLWCS